MDDKLPEITPETFQKASKVRHPLAGLPAYLKEPESYEKVQKLVIESLAGKHSHGEVVEWAACLACQKRFHERGDVLKRLGFRSIPQYMAWKKVHEQMRSLVRDPLR